jgi:hypothetical protein
MNAYGIYVLALVSDLILLRLRLFLLYNIYDLNKMRHLILYVMLYSIVGPTQSPYQVSVMFQDATYES